MQKLTFKKGYYKESTPPILRMVGDFLNYVSASAAVYTVIQDDKGLAILFIVIGAAGKAITNAFTTAGE
jgi:hypothetical protein